MSSEMVRPIKGKTPDGHERGWGINGKYMKYGMEDPFDVIGPYEVPTVSPRSGFTFRTLLRNIRIDGFITKYGSEEWTASELPDLRWDKDGKAVHLREGRWSNWDLLECLDISGATLQFGALDAAVPVKPAPRPGDTVTVKAKVDQTFGDGSISLRRVQPSEVLHVEPQPLKIGDTVSHYYFSGRWKITGDEWDGREKWFVLEHTGNGIRVKVPATDKHLERKS